MSKYKEWTENEDNLILIKGWARDGCTDEMIAERMGIAVSTLYEWKKKYTEFSEALKKGKEVIDYQVENALLNSALDGNVAAIIFWLCNRKPDTWKNKQNIEHKGDVEVTNPFKGLSTEELKKLASDG
jgi:hypothetical protein|nr:MAG TPA: terminase small subunit [Caudoviricetes sp.]